MSIVSEQNPKDDPTILVVEDHPMNLERLGLSPLGSGGMPDQKVGFV